MNISFQQTCQDLTQLVNCVKHNMGELAEERHLTSVQFYVLYLLVQHHELSMGQIAHFLHCDASNVTIIMRSLLKNNLVVRQPAPNDRRTKNICLTKSGRQIVDEVVEALPDRIGCKILSAQEQLALHSIVQKIGGV